MEHFSRLNDCIVKGILLFVVAILVVVTIREFTRNQILVEPILVPPEISDAGYTDQVLARRIRDEIDRILIETGGLQFGEQTTISVSAPDDVNSLDVSVPGSGLSLKWIVEYFKPTASIGGEIVRLGSNDLVLRSRVKNAKNDKISTGARSIIFEVKESNIDEMVKKTGQRYLEITRPTILAAYYNKQGADLITKGDFAGAIGKFKKSISLQPADPTNDERMHIAETYTNWGLALSKNHEERKAIAKFKQALEIWPTSTYTYVVWGQILGDRQDGRSQAFEKFEKALELDRNYDYAYLAEGVILFNEQRFDDAERKLRRTIESNPNSAFAHVLIGSILSRRGDGDGAITEFRQALKAEGTYDYAYIAWGDVLFDRGEYAEAEAKFRRAIEINDDYDYAGVRRGEALAAQGDREGAVEQFEEVAQLKPLYDYTYIAWGKLRRSAGEDGAAAERFREAIRCNPDHAESHALLGQVLAAQGRRTEALKEYDNALALRPDPAFPAEQIQALKAELEAQPAGVLSH